MRCPFGENEADAKFVGVHRVAAAFPSCISQSEVTIRRIQKAVSAPRYNLPPQPTPFVGLSF